MGNCWHFMELEAPGFFGMMMKKNGSGEGLRRERVRDEREKEREQEREQERARERARERAVVIGKKCKCNVRFFSLEKKRQ